MIFVPSIKKNCFFFLLYWSAALICTTYRGSAAHTDHLALNGLKTSGEIGGGQALKESDNPELLSPVLLQEKKKYFAELLRTIAKEVRWVSREQKPFILIIIKHWIKKEKSTTLKQGLPENICRYIGDMAGDDLLFKQENKEKSVQSSEKENRLGIDENIQGKIIEGKVNTIVSFFKPLSERESSQRNKKEVGQGDDDNKKRIYFNPSIVDIGVLFYKGKNLSKDKLCLFVQSWKKENKYMDSIRKIYLDFFRYDKTITSKHFKVIDTLFEIFARTNINREKYKDMLPFLVRYILSKGDMDETIHRKRDKDGKKAGCMIKKYTNVILESLDYINEMKTEEEKATFLAPFYIYYNKYEEDTGYFTLEEKSQLKQFFESVTLYEVKLIECKELFEWMVEKQEALDQIVDEKGLYVFPSDYIINVLSKRINQINDEEEKRKLLYGIYRAYESNTYSSTWGVGFKALKLYQVTFEEYLSVADWEMKVGVYADTSQSIPIELTPTEWFDLEKVPAEYITTRWKNMIERISNKKEVLYSLYGHYRKTHTMNLTQKKAWEACFTSHQVDEVSYFLHLLRKKYRYILFFGLLVIFMAGYFWKKNKGAAGRHLSGTGRKRSV